MSKAQASYVAGFPCPPRSPRPTRLADRTSGLVELALRFRTANCSLDHSNRICRTSILQQKLTPSTVAVLQEFETAAQRTARGALHPSSQPQPQIKATIEPINGHLSARDHGRADTGNDQVRRESLLRPDKRVCVKMSLPASWATKPAAKS